jgi:hypothetical protein
MKVTRLSVKLDRMWSRRKLQEVKRMQKKHSDLREWLYKTNDQKLDRMRWGLKDYIADTIQLRYGFIKSYPDCPRLMYK